MPFRLSEWWEFDFILVRFSLIVLYIISGKIFKDRNIKVFNGLDMFIYQGQKHFLE